MSFQLVRHVFPFRTANTPFTPGFHLDKLFTSLLSQRLLVSDSGDGRGVMRYRVTLVSDKRVAFREGDSSITVMELCVCMLKYVLLYHVVVFPPVFFYDQ